jgi:hypothetical protein
VARADSISLQTTTSFTWVLPIASALRNRYLVLERLQKEFILPVHPMDIAGLSKIHESKMNLSQGIFWNQTWHRPLGIQGFMTGTGNCPELADCILAISGSDASFHSSFKNRLDENWIMSRDLLT